MAWCMAHRAGGKSLKLESLEDENKKSSKLKAQGKTAKDFMRLNHLNYLNDPYELNHKNDLNLSNEIYAVTAKRISSGPSKRTQRS
jgi:hypothetical protein